LQYWLFAEAPGLSGAPELSRVSHQRSQLEMVACAVTGNMEKYCLAGQCSRLGGIQVFERLLDFGID
jgi:hypothetical protein